MLRISISGTHSSGKTTLLNALQEDKDIKELKVKFIDGTTRKVKKLGIPINEAGEDATQLLCMSMDLLNYHQPYKEDEVVISDRCLLDTFIYTKHLYLRGKVSKMCFQVVESTWELYKSKYDIILIPNHYEVPLEDDNERSVNRQFRDSIHLLFMEEVNKDIGFYATLLIGGPVKSRVETVKEIIEEFKQQQIV